MPLNPAITKFLSGSQYWAPDDEEEDVPPEAPAAAPAPLAQEAATADARTTQPSRGDSTATPAMHPAISLMLEKRLAGRSPEETAMRRAGLQQAQKRAATNQMLAGLGANLSSAASTYSGVKSENPLAQAELKSANQPVEDFEKAQADQDKEEREQAEAGKQLYSMDKDTATETETRRHHTALEDQLKVGFGKNGQVTTVNPNTGERTVVQEAQPGRVQVEHNIDGSLSAVERNPDGSPKLTQLVGPTQRAGKAGGGGTSAGAKPVPEVVERLAHLYNDNGGNFPRNSLPTGKEGNALRALVMARAAELARGDANDSLAGKGASNKADTASLSSMQKLVDNSEAYARTAGRNLDVFLGTAKEIGDTNSPLLNKPLREIENQLSGDPRLAAANAARVTAITEIGKALSGATGGGVLSDSARHEAESLLGPNATLAQYMAAAKILKSDIENKRKEYARGLSEIKARISGKAPKESAASASDHDKAAEWLADPTNKSKPNYARVKAAYEAAHGGDK